MWGWAAGAAAQREGRGVTIVGAEEDNGQRASDGTSIDRDDAIRSGDDRGCGAAEGREGHDRLEDRGGEEDACITSNGSSGGLSASMQHPC